VLKRRTLSGAAGILVAIAVAAAARESPRGLYVLNLEGQWVDPLQSADAKAIVFVFTATDCPISNRYAPEIRRLHDRFRSRGVAFWLVYPDPAESVDAIRRHIAEYGYPSGALRDPGHGLVRLSGATVTPEVAVFQAGRRMVYRGRLDDRYESFSRVRPVATEHDLEEVLAALLAGKPLRRATTPAIGCFIRDLP